MNSTLLPLEQFYSLEKKLSQKVYLRQPIDGKWLEYTWQEVGKEARKLAQGLINLNLPPQSCIALLSKNCAHWIIADVAIWMAGHISVPLYPTSNSETIEYVLNHCNAPVLITGKLDEWEKQKSSVPSHIQKISFPFWQNSETQSWDDFLKGVNPLSTFPKRKSDEISTIIYTSGTTGKPKGVVHTFYTMISNIDEALRIIKIDSHDRFISYLPLSHVAERLLIELGSLYTGGEVSFAESIDSFKKNLQEIKPTVFLAVPRIWLKFQQGILQKLPQKKLNILLRVPILNSIIKRKIKAGLGLDQLRFAVTGAAAISKELLEWFDKLDIRVHEVYGMTENFGISSFNSPGKVKFGTVGTIFPYTEAKISLDGEILTRSKSIMVEYFKEPEKTNEMIDKEGWLHTGDLGEISSDGYLKITGRVKDLFKTSKGKYVSPTHIENFFTQCELIEQVCVVGSGLPQPIALVTLSDCGKKAQKSEVQSECLNLLKYINEKVQNYERLNNVVIINDEWSVDTGILTPTLKLKRNVVEKNYEKRLHTWVESSTEVIFQ